MKTLLLSVALALAGCNPILAATPVPAPEFIFSPDEPAQARLLAFIGEAKELILIADYSFVMPELTDLLIAKQNAGVHVFLVLDRIQASGRSEKAELAKLDAAKVPYVVGTSDQGGHIMHHKFAVIDSAAVLFGSYNFTTTAAKESNVFCIVRYPSAAARFADEWHKIDVFMRARAK